MRVGGDLQKVRGLQRAPEEPGKVVLGCEEHEDLNIGSFRSRVANATWLKILNLVGARQGL